MKLLIFLCMLFASFDNLEGGEWTFNRNNINQKRLSISEGTHTDDIVPITTCERINCFLWRDDRMNKSRQFRLDLSIITADLEQMRMKYSAEEWDKVSKVLVNLLHIKPTPLYTITENEELDFSNKEKMPSYNSICYKPKRSGGLTKDIPGVYSPRPTLKRKSNACFHLATNRKKPHL